MSCPYNTSQITSYLNNCITNQSLESCQSLNTSLVACNESIQNIINNMNQQVIQLNSENTAIKANLLESNNKTNLSGQLFMGYKEQYSIFYFRNWAMIIAIGFLIAGLLQALLNTNEGEEIKTQISKKIL